MADRSEVVGTEDRRWSFTIVDGLRGPYYRGLSEMEAHKVRAENRIHLWFAINKLLFLKSSNPTGIRYY
jgi:hypothetical protein